MRLRCRIPLANFTLDIDASFDSRVTAFFGPSGSGKTSLLDAIAGLREIAAGEIEVNGRTLYSSERGVNLSPQQRGIGYVPQEGALFPHLSVKTNVLFGAARSAGAAGADNLRTEHVLEVLEIGHLLDRSVTKLSGGEAQRIALARAILSRPRLLLLDEPLAALDIGLKERILPYLARVRDEFSIPMIYVTHNLTEVLTLADWVLMIRNGRLIAQGKPKETLATGAAAREIDEEQLQNVFTVTFTASDLAAGRTVVRLASGTEIVIPYMTPVRPIFQVRVGADDILLGTGKQEGLSAANILPGEIHRIDVIDGQALVWVVAGEEFCVRLTAAGAARLGLAVGAWVYLIIKARSFHVI